jgi:hypothetical protein
MRRRVFALGMGVVMGLMGPQAEAFNLTGIWKGTQTCHIYTANGQRELQTFQDDVLAISQSDSDVRLYMGSVHLLYVGRAFTDAASQKKGAVAFRLCGLTDDLAAKGEMGRAQVNLQPAQPDVFRASSIYAEDDEVDRCQWTYQRVSRDDPGVPVCQEGAPPNQLDPKHP